MARRSAAPSARPGAGRSTSREVSALTALPGRRAPAGSAGRSIRRPPSARRSRPRRPAQRLLADRHRPAGPTSGSVSPYSVGEVRVEQPGLLHELELAGDVGVEAHEQQAAVLAVVLPRDRRSSARTCGRGAGCGGCWPPRAASARRPRPAPARRADWPGARASRAGSRGRADRPRRTELVVAAARTRRAGEMSRRGTADGPSRSRPITRSASHSAVTWVALGSCSRIARGVLVHRVPERGDVLLAARAPPCSCR